MKRLHTYKESPLRKLTLLLAGLIAATGMLIAAQGASAAPLAPEITAKPANPNTTHAISTFDFHVGSGETEDIRAFQCRQYKTSTPPADPSADWQDCVNASLEQPNGIVEGTKSYANLANESQTLEVRGSTYGNEPGPASTYTWSQNVTTVPPPPVITSGPDDPNTTSFDSIFKWEEDDLVGQYQCSINSGPWLTGNVCYSGFSYKDTPEGEGPHEFRLRGVNVAGPSEATVYTWTNDLPNPGVSVDVNDVASARWDGREAFAGAGAYGPSIDYRGTTSVGDINGDGRDDLLTDQSNVFDDMGMYVLFSSAGKDKNTIADIGPEQGYRMNFSNGGFLFREGPFGGYDSIGDQNGDGVPDLIFTVAYSGYDFVGGTTSYVVYGVKDPSELPLCENSAKTHCLDVDSMSPNQGYALVGNSGVRPPAPGGLYGLEAPTAGSAGDFDGDGVDDLALSAAEFGSPLHAPYRVFIIKGGVARSGTLDYLTMDPDDVLTVIGNPIGDIASQGIGAQGIQALGDLNLDGRDDVFLSDFGQGGGYILYGRGISNGPVDLSDFSPTDGIRIYGPALSSVKVKNTGDVNVDGRPDLAITSLKNQDTFTEKMQAIDIVYGSEQLAQDSIVLGDLPEGSGYRIRRGDIPALIGSDIQSVGDFNNDGVDDLLATASVTSIDNEFDSGAAYLLLGQNPLPENGMEVGPNLAVGTGLAITGSNSEQTGKTIAVLGDLDGDGLRDFALGSPGSDFNGLEDSGSIYIVPGKSIIDQVKTGSSVGVDNDSAALNASVSTNNRDSEVWFEYGTTDEYGKTTTHQEFEGSNNGDAASAAIDGLTKGTEYHYRAVAKNALGLVRYGDDKTFTTTNVADPDPVETCDLDPTGPGCASYCQANPTAMGCPDFDWCAANPGKCNNGGTKKTNAKLGLITTPKTIKVKRGKKGSVSAIVFNSGGKTATGVKVCVKAPKKLIKVKKCQKIGSLASGKTKTRQFKVKVTKKAKKGKKITLKFTATSKNAGKKTAKAKVKVVR